MRIGIVACSKQGHFWPRKFKKRRDGGVGGALFLLGFAAPLRDSCIARRPRCAGPRQRRGWRWGSGYMFRGAGGWLGEGGTGGGARPFGACNGTKEVFVACKQAARSASSQSRHAGQECAVCSSRARGWGKEETASFRSAAAYPVPTRPVLFYCDSNQPYDCYKKKPTLRFCSVAP